MMRTMDRISSQLARWWRPLAAATIGIALLGAAVAEARISSGRLAATLRLLAAAALILAAALAVIVALRPSAADDAEQPGRGEADATDVDEEAAMALVEVAHERDVSIARVSEAEDRARLAGDRLATLAPLEQRLQIAERRALDAERRLDEIDERVDAASNDAASNDAASNDDASTDDADADPEPSAAARRATELRASLARAAARKKPSGGGR
jgi:hypothetical protein